MEEIWKDIPGYEGKYQVSNLGKVKSLDCIEEYMCKNGTLVCRKRKGTYIYQSILKKTTNKYYIVSLWSKGKVKTIGVHRLVGICFINNPLNKKEINHIDGNGQNNIVTNLEWATRSENEIHSYAILGKQAWSKGKKMKIESIEKRVKSRKETAKNISEKIYQEYIESGLSLAEFERLKNKSESTYWHRFKSHGFI